MFLSTFSVISYLLSVLKKNAKNDVCVCVCIRGSTSRNHLYHLLCTFVIWQMKGNSFVSKGEKNLRVNEWVSPFNFLKKHKHIWLFLFTRQQMHSVLWYSNLNSVAMKQTSERRRKKIVAFLNLTPLMCFDLVFGQCKCSHYIFRFDTVLSAQMYTHLQRCKLWCLLWL